MQFYLKTPKAIDSLIMMRKYDAQFKDGVFTYSARERIVTKNWDFKKERPKPGQTNDAILSRLLELDKESEDYILLNRKYLTRDGLRDYLNGNRPKEVSEEVLEDLTVKEPSLLFLWDEYLFMIKGTVNWKTLRAYTHVFEAFKKFATEKNKLELRPSELDIRIYNSYLSFLNENFAPNSAARHLKNFKRFIKFLKKTSTPSPLSPDEISYKEKAGIRISLSQEELDKLYKHKIKGTLNNIRWLFLLQCYTGVRVSDLFRIGKSIRNGYIDLETTKVRGNRLKQPLTKMVIEILEMYNYNLPFINEQYYRQGIKAIYKAINPNGKIEVRLKDGSFKDVYIHEEISSHDAVRTFITRCAEKGMSITAIALMTGKSEAVIYKHYLVSSQKNAEAEMIKAWG